MAFIPIYLIFIPIIASMLVYLLHNKYVNYIIFAAQFFVTLLALKYYSIYNGLTKAQILSLGNWEKNIGIVLKNDQLSIAFIFLSIFIWWIILIYCWNKRKNDFKFLFFLMFLEGCFLGLLQTNDLFNLFVFIEIITIISTILILYKKDGYSVRAGLYYLLFNSTGMLFYLLGLILIYNVSGTLNIDITAQKISVIKDTNFIKLGYIFIMAAIGVKSAFFPVFNWLPKAHGAAPSSISALLSGLLVKSGLYAFIRLNDMFKIKGFEDFFFFLGFLTAICGIIFALSQKDIKQILAFHTISQIGMILIGISSSDSKIYIGGLMHIFNHAIFKSLLFLGAGAIINSYGIRRITEIRGVFKRLPFISICMIIGMLSITGAPLFNGFVSKTIIKYGIGKSSTKILMLFIINLGTSISFIKLSQIFWGTSARENHKNINVYSSMLLLTIMCIVLGIYYKPIIMILFGVNISYIHVFKIKNFISYIFTLSAGYIIYRKAIRKDHEIIQYIRHINISFGATNFLLITFVFIMILWEEIGKFL
ncbi:complex I subunit 5 family protein [Paramaledivibacter caminithermalis]|jgi:multicomponent Na+:H+ antiporter subunit D|uniref:Multisubunit sodium/proton antiporter, MrpD subunit n=1 Tax=Paramaledivibacter caminithermalis (strain DSM 15212 / CIP 107654 / DViRD3) TaxID=1121301 RepID=A0A1M6MHC2_PARC5|nr:proton-conducting transporter membrane subunit [Paramaledivibacter caminithermalis]SHJ82766.1 multisubunit sodium/proton antiporter, MrpD subunit [Paramaledivibacter caminithermalis DSM 15212]